MLFTHALRLSGDPAQGDAAGGCHYNVTSFRLTDYTPLVADDLQGNVVAPASITERARQNYQTSQARMKRDPEVAPLLQRPLRKAAHPRADLRRRQRRGRRHSRMGDARLDANEARSLSPFALAVLFSAGPALRRGASDADVFARVVVAETELRAGPGISHRVIHRRQARRGLPDRDARNVAAIWLRGAACPTGARPTCSATRSRPSPSTTTRRTRRASRASSRRPRSQDAHGGLALMGGVYDLDGYAEVRPALVLAPAIAFEPYVGLALEPDSRRIVYGLRRDAQPGAGLGDRAVRRARHRRRARGRRRTSSSAEERNWFHARAGGGLLISLRFRILFRLEASNIVLFTEDDYDNVQSYIGGLGSYF